MTTKYNFVDGNVTWQQTGTNSPIYFLYDASGSLWGLKYTDGNIYFYVKDAQGDIIKIVNSTGTVVVEYAYDAWGNLMSTIGSLASTLGNDNPFRYRGYYYDTETNLYYLQSRYYSPEWGRFLNADIALGKIGDLLSHNVFTYCQNDPVNKVDPSGHDSLPFSYIDHHEDEVLRKAPTTSFSYIDHHEDEVSKTPPFSYIDHKTYDEDVRAWNHYFTVVGPSAEFLALSTEQRAKVVDTTIWFYVGLTVGVTFMVIPGPGGAMLNAAVGGWAAGAYNGSWLQKWRDDLVYYKRDDLMYYK